MIRFNEINYITDYEYAKIITTIEVLFNKRFHCFTCKTKYANRTDHETMTMKVREMQSCFSVRDAPVMRATQQSASDIEYYTCPGNFFDRSVVELLEVVNNYEKGNLPFEGPLCEQPSKMLDIIQMIQDVKNKKNEEERKKRDQQNQRKSRGR